MSKYPNIGLNQGMANKCIGKGLSQRKKLLHSSIEARGRAAIQVCPGPTGGGKGSQQAETAPKENVELGKALHTHACTHTHIHTHRLWIG